MSEGLGGRARILASKDGVENIGNISLRALGIDLADGAEMSFKGLGRHDQIWPYFTSEIHRLSCCTMHHHACAVNFAAG